MGVGGVVILVLAVVFGLFALWWMLGLFLIPFSMGWEFADSESSFMKREPTFGMKVVMFGGALVYLGLSYLAVKGIGFENEYGQTREWLMGVVALLWWPVVPFVIGAVVGTVMKGHVPMAHKQEARIEELEREIKEMRRRGGSMWSVV